MTADRFTLETFNGHDQAAPARGATFVGLQERAPLERLEAVFADLGLTLWAPAGLQEAMAWDSDRFTLEGKGREFLHGDGRSYGHPLTTPERWALWIAGRLDGHKVAVIDTHLINNAYGAPIRGERRLRRRLWRKGWRVVKRLRRRLEALGYAVFVVGDLNRTARYWTPPRTYGRGFDRIMWPRQVEPLEAWPGNANGSDHRPLFASFRFKAGQ